MGGAGGRSPPGEKPTPEAARRRSTSSGALRRGRGLAADARLVRDGASRGDRRQYTYAGEAESPDGKAYVIDVKNADSFTARLFIDQQTHLPLMVTYKGPQPRVMTSGGRAGGARRGRRRQPRRDAGARRQLTDEERKKLQADAEKQIQEMQQQPPVMVEFTLFFEDWREVDGVKFPHKMRRAIAGATDRGVDGQQGQGQPEDRSEEVRRLKGARYRRDMDSRIHPAGAGVRCCCLMRSGVGARPRPAAADRHAARGRQGPERRGDPRRRVVQIKGAEPATQDVARADVVVGRPGRGQRAERLAPGRYAVEVAFPGFETATMPDVRVRAGDNRREVTLAIEKLDESVAVGRDPATVASDPNSDRFSNVLSKDQIDALPDDPDEMERVLKEMAGPGGDDPRGRLPRRQAAAEVADPLDPLRQRHVRGREPQRRHDVRRHRARSPALGPLRGSMDFTFRDDSLNARNAFQPEKGPEQTQQYNVQPERHAAEGSHVVLAVAPAARRSTTRRTSTPRCRTARATAPMRRPSDRINFNRPGRSRAQQVAHAARHRSSRTATTSGTSASAASTSPERAFARTSSESVLRLSESGPLARLVVRRVAAAGPPGRHRRRRPTLEAPTVRVLDAFTSGGAQQAGGRAQHRHRVRHQHRLRHAASTRMRMGALVEGGILPQRQPHELSRHLHVPEPRRLRGRPAGELHAGASAIRWSSTRTWQAGVFFQDDWRARKNLTLSAGVRQEFQTHLDDRWNFAPRGRLHLVAVQERQDDGPRRRRHLLRLARGGDLRADAARRRRPPAGPRDRQPRLSRIRSAAARRRRCCRPASTCSPAAS